MTDRYYVRVSVDNHHVQIIRNSDDQIVRTIPGVGASSKAIAEQWVRDNSQ